MENEIFVKVSVQDELPECDGNYLTGNGFYIFTKAAPINGHKNSWHGFEGGQYLIDAKPLYWLKKVSVSTYLKQKQEELLGELEKASQLLTRSLSGVRVLRDMLNRAQLEKGKEVSVEIVKDIESFLKMFEGREK